MQWSIMEMKENMLGEKQKIKENIPDGNGNKMYTMKIIEQDRT